MGTSSSFGVKSKLLVLGLAVSTFGLVSIQKNSLAEKNGPTCPHFLVVDGDDPNHGFDQVPTTLVDSECRLNQDVVGLVKTLRVKSGIKLNCQGHKITPTAPGVVGDSASRSAPELAIFMMNVEGTQVNNCDIEGFDHAILAMDSKGDADAPPDQRNGISHNKIVARFVGGHLNSADNCDIDGNDVTWLTQGGAGIYVQNDSDSNEVKNNTVTGDFGPKVAQGAVIFPGPTATGPTGVLPSNGNSNPLFNSGHGAIILA